MEMVIFAAGILVGASVAAAIGFLWQRLGNERTFGTISEQLRSAAEINRKVQEDTAALHAALGHPIMRGNWGEKMVEDVLRPAGFVEKFSYLKQETMDCNSGRPDYTFLLPRDLKVNLDAKFPFDNYRAYHNAETDEMREEYKKRFLRDVRCRLKELSNREYVVAGTLDFVLMFVPNEQVYSFINLNDPELFDFALGKKVILCSPWTLYPILSIMHMAIDNFILEKNTAELLPLLGRFDKQWDEYKGCLGELGKRLDQAQEEYKALLSTRQRKLEKVLEDVERLRNRTVFSAAENGVAVETSPSRTVQECVQPCTLQRQ